MVIRLLLVLALVFGLTGCLKKASDESMSTDAGVMEENMTGAGEETMDQGKSVSVEADFSQPSSMEKPTVQDIQEALKSAGLYQGRIDGILGPNTRKAIETFQLQNDLKVDGKVGPKTWEKLKEYLDRNPE
ncbi:MAG: peptidoglycan-binding protein [Candidatus Omnitrophota bacterium]|jgi:peptidoglycan hydrolase-like protein with peptidoglycan-binding domain